MGVWQKAGVALVMLLAVASTDASAAARTSLDSLTLPGPAEGLAAAVGLPPDTPRARLLVDVIRLIHQLPPGQLRDVDVARAAALDWLATAGPPATNGDAAGRLVPSPLPGTAWTTLSQSLGATTLPTVTAVLSDRRLAFLYVGLLGCPAETRTWLAAHPDLLTELARRSPGAAAAFLRSVSIVAGRLQLPGGDPLRHVWNGLVGEPPDAPERFVPALLARDGGRVAWLVDVLSTLPDQSRRWALTPAAAEETPREALAALARVFAAHEVSWRVEDRPFSRPAIDGFLVLAGLRVGDDGRWRGPTSRRFWRDVFDGRDPSGDEEDWHEAVAEAEPVSAGWLLERVLVTDPAVARRRYGAVRFVQRLFADAPAPMLVQVLHAARGLIEQPALVLTLERVGVRDARVFARAVMRARQLSSIARGAGSPMPLAQFQAALALLDRAVRVHARSTDIAVRAVDRLLTLDPSEDGYGMAVARWTREHLGAIDGDDVQVFSGPAGGVAPRVVWEELPYDLDLARSERRRLGTLLERQRAPALTDAWTFVDAAEPWLTDEPLADPQSARTLLLAAADRFGAVRSPLFSARPAALSLGDQVGRVVGQPSGRPRALSRGRARDLSNLIDHVITEAMLTMVYAAHLGDPDGPVALVPDIARRHAFAVDPRGDAVADAWNLPVEQHSGAGGWRVGGSLLGLEHALAGLALRAQETGEMPEPSRLSEAGQQLTALGVSLMDPLALRDDTRSRLVALVDLGRRRLHGLCEHHDVEEQPPMGPIWRVETTTWACANDPGTVARLWTDSDALTVASVADSMPALQPWGAPALPPEGPLALQWAVLPNVDDLEGRPATGLVTTHVVDLTVRVARWTEARQLPAALVPALLERAAFHVLHAAPLIQPDDWYRLALASAALDDDRFEDFMAALAADGPLMSPRPDR